MAGVTPRRTWTRRSRRPASASPRLALLLDTGAVYAYYDADDEWHGRVRPLLDGESQRRLIPAVVLPELDHLLGHRLGRPARHALYEDIVDGVYDVMDLAPERWARVLELNVQFRDLDLGLVDAAVATLSEQLGVRRLATTDRRHFPAIQAAVSLELLP